MEINAFSFATNDEKKRRLQHLARHILDERERRQWYFPRVLFDELPWQMLLLLYLSETSRLSSEALCNGVLARPATGNRWIDYLASEGLVTQHFDPSDNSRSMVELAPKGLDLLQLYLSDRLQRGELQTEPKARVTHFARSARVAILVLVAAVLSAIATYVLTSLGAVPKILD